MVVSQICLPEPGSDSAAIVMPVYAIMPIFSRGQYRHVVMYGGMAKLPIRLRQHLYTTLAVAMYLKF